MAGAYQVSSKLFAGFSARHSKLDLQTSTLRFSGCIDPNESSCRQVNATSIDESPSAFGFAAGILLLPSFNFSIGIVYEYNPRFDYEQRFDGLVSDRTFAPATDVPDRAGIGFAIRPTDTLVFLADFVWIQYSDLVRSFTVVIAAGSGEVTPQSFEVEDGLELHIGAEKLFSLGTSLLALRGGLLTIPASDFKYIGSRNTLDGITADELFNSLQAETEVGFTFGGGVVISDRFQIDAAYLVSDPFDEFSLSTVFRF